MLLLETGEQETRQGFGWVEELQNRGETDNWIKDILDIEAAIEDKIANLGLKQLKQAIIGDAQFDQYFMKNPA